MLKEAEGIEDYVDKTEKIESCNPAWEKPISLDFRAEETQKLRFEIRKFNEDGEHTVIGVFYIRLSEIILKKARGNTSRLPNENGPGHLVVDVVKAGEEKSIIDLFVEGW